VEVGGKQVIDCLTSLERDVQIVIKEASRRRTEGILRFCK
jgi:hypothetical protein